MVHSHTVDNDEEGNNEAKNKIKNGLLRTQQTTEKKPLPIVCGKQDSYGRFAGQRSDFQQTIAEDECWVRST